ncbi:MAG: ABC transporter substrate-binding protein [Acidaminococcaceae bacterium]|jgi:branched-chain amino acid transport system substrate-binding protein|nr:ABC transporter substrate-binding protein [Acidaminococcaceae bacterium]MCI2110247.1 ABC transporter substrate-binding protein [Acidaminococcaceae bacterium]
MQTGKKLLAILCLGTMLAGAVTGCGKSGSSAKEIKIGGNLEMTGTGASYGKSSQNGIKLAIEKINGQGGVLGKKLALSVADNKSEAAEATNAMQKLISQDKVVAVIGPSISSCVIATTAVNAGAKVLDISPLGTNPKVTVDQNGKTRAYNFRTCFIDPFQGTVMAKFVKDTLKAKKVAILVDNSSDYSKGLAQYFEETFTKNGGTIVAKESFLQKDTDFKATLTKIQATNPDMIYVPAYYQEVGLIVKQARELGITVPMAGGDGWDSAKMPEIAGKAALNKTFFSSLYSPEDNTPMNKEFVAAYEKAYNEKPDVFAALSYDSTLLIAEALKKAGEVNSAKVAAAMAEIKGLEGVSGKVTFDAQHNPVKSAFIIEYKDGKQSFKTKIEPK